jgi:predicted nuclease of predicted toxin-antitoxin system
VKLLIDMNLSPAWVDFLRAAGIEAAHWASIGERDAPDTDIMAYAAARGYVVLTHDLDFGAILAATNGAKPSVVQADIFVWSRNQGFRSVMGPYKSAASQFPC